MHRCVRVGGWRDFVRLELSHAVPLVATKRVAFETRSRSGLVSQLARARALALSKLVRKHGLSVRAAAPDTRVFRTTIVARTAHSWARRSGSTSLAPPVAQSRRRALNQCPFGSWTYRVRRLSHSLRLSHLLARRQRRHPRLPPFNRARATPLTFVGAPRWPEASAWGARRPQRSEDAGRSSTPYARGITRRECLAARARFDRRFTKRFFERSDRPRG